MIELDDSRIQLALYFLNSIVLKDEAVRRTSSPVVSKRTRKEAIPRKWPIDDKVKDRILYLAFGSPFAVSSLLTFEGRLKRGLRIPARHGLPYERSALIAASNL
jgi:hypothetical protein